MAKKRMYRKARGVYQRRILNEAKTLSLDEPARTIDGTVVQDLYQVQGGGTRSEAKPAYHLVPGHGARRTAMRFGLGASIHGAENWKLSCSNELDARVWCEQAYDHMMDHALKMGAREETFDDHLGAIGWAVEILAYCEHKFGKVWTEFGR